MHLFILHPSSINGAKPSITANHKKLKNPLESCKKKRKKKRSWTHNNEKHQDERQIKPSPSMMTSKTNCHAAVINASWVGPSDWSMHSTQHHGIGPGVLPKGRSLCRAYTHTKAAGLPHFPTRDATWHDESFLVPRLQLLCSVPQKDVVLFLRVVVLVAL